MTEQHDIDAAAERLIDSYEDGCLFAFGVSGGEWSAWVRPDRAKQMVEIMRAYLAQRARERSEAEERDKPVNEEWIASLNPPRYWEAGREYSWPTVGLRYAIELVGVSGVGEPGFYIDGRYEPLFLKHITTRGQVLDLLRALGVETKKEGE